MIPYAEERGVTLLVETNGVYADTARLAGLLNQIESDNIGALWDMHHPFRYGNETPEQTVQNLGAYIKYTHIKGFRGGRRQGSLQNDGEGDLPVDAIMRALRSINYEGYISLEWLKSYMPELNDAGVVFPHSPTLCPSTWAGKTESRRLYDNNQKTGKYVWPKEHLIDLTFPRFWTAWWRSFRTSTPSGTPPWITPDLFPVPGRRGYLCPRLIAMGVRPGDHVAIWATNVPQWYITFWATTKIGAVLVTVNTAYKIHEAEYLLRQSDTHTLVMIDGSKDSDYVGIIKELCPELATTPKGRPSQQKPAFPAQFIVTVDSNPEGLLYLGGGPDPGRAGSHGGGLSPGRRHP